MVGAQLKILQKCGTKSWKVGKFEKMLQKLGKM